MGRIKLAIGDVFSLPLSNTEVGFGQCVTNYIKQSGGFMAVFYPFKADKESDYNVDQFVNMEPLLIGYTFDSLLTVLPKWKIIANTTQNLSTIILPLHRVISNGKMIMVNAYGENIAEIPHEIYEQLSNKLDIAPIRYENALKAYFGYQEWLPENYDKLLYIHSLKSQEVARNLLKPR